MISQVSTLFIPERPGLDAITVYWHNYAPQKGMVTIVCWGSAWNSYFGGMGEDKTIQKFFAEAYTTYLVDKLGFTQWLKKSKQHEMYLARVIDAIKAALKLEAL